MNLDLIYQFNSWLIEFITIPNIYISETLEIELLRIIAHNSTIIVYILWSGLLIGIVAFVMALIKSLFYMLEKHF